ncbi:MAG: hypothetical protein E3J25_01335 [Anaerolineales bacterium]|nr:MAG: hypothetical protein E3J25_01335 [Anaerolineales bacterium]
MTDTQGEACPTCKEYGAALLRVYAQVAALVGALWRMRNRAKRIMDGEISTTAYAAADYDFQVAEEVLANLPAEALKIARKAQAHDDMAAALRVLEWLPETEGDWAECPCCGQRKMDGHLIDGCQLAAALAEKEPE